MMGYWRPLFLSLTLLLLLVACGGGEETAVPSEEAAPTAEPVEESSDVVVQETIDEEDEQPTLTPPPIPTAVPEEVPTEPPAEEATTVPEEEPAVEVIDEIEAVQPEIENITFEAADGLEIQATYATPGGEAPFPGILLLHMLGSNRKVWLDSGLVDALRLQGYAVLAVDMRGHGETGGEIDWTLARQDLAAIYDQFADFEAVNGEKTAVIGGSIGGNMALALTVDRAEIDTAVLLSPGLDYRGVTTGDLAEQYGSRPLYIAVSQEDGYAASSSQSLVELAENGTLELYNGIGHGTTMLANEPALTDLILSWLSEVLDG